MMPISAICRRDGAPCEYPVVATLRSPVKRSLRLVKQGWNSCLSKMYPPLARRRGGQAAFLGQGDQIALGLNCAAPWRALWWWFTRTLRISWWQATSRACVGRRKSQQGGTRHWCRMVPGGERKGRLAEGPGPFRLLVAPPWGREMPMRSEGSDHFVGRLGPKFLICEEILIAGSPSIVETEFDLGRA